MQIIKSDNAWDGLFTGANCLKDLKTNSSNFTKPAKS